MAEVGQLIAAFLGGGLAKSILDHLLTDRSARRTDLRPVDKERIAIVRETLWRHYAQRSTVEHTDFTEQEMFGTLGPAIAALADGRLLTLWNRFITRAMVVPHAQDGFDLQKRVKQGDFVRMERAHQRILNRLNKLERRR